MPSSFASFSNGDVVEASHVAEMHAPIQNLERGAAFYAGTTGGSSTAYSATLSPAPDNPYQAGMIVNFKIHADNTAGSPDVTLNVNGVGAKPILKGGGDSLAAGDLKAGQMASVVYDSASGGAFKLVGGSSVGDLDDLTDVAISSPSTGQVVRYNGSQFVNANLAAGDMPSGIDASKIGSGAVSDTEFGYLDGVTSAIQTQINGKAASSHTHELNDLTDVVISTLNAGDVIGYNGTNFRNVRLAATDIASGSVSNTEFGYLDGVTGAIQTQLNGKAPSISVFTLVRNSDYTLTSSTTYYSVPWEAAHFNSGGSSLWQSGTDPDRITLYRAGFWLVGVIVMFERETNALNYLNSRINVNSGGGVFYVQNEAYAPSTGSKCHHSYSGIVYSDGNDYATFEAMASGAGHTLLANSRIWGAYLGPG